MPTPTAPSSRYYAAGGAKGATWGTAAATGAAKGLLLTKDGGPKLNQKYIPNREIDQVEVKGGGLGPIGETNFAPEFDMRYDPGFLGSFIASLFGTAGVPAAGGATSKVHTIKWADAYAQFFTFAVERPAQIWEVPSVVPYKLNIKAAEGFMGGVISLRGSPWTNGSAVNTATQMDAITYVDTDGTRRIKLGQGVVWMNAESGAALQASDKIDVSEIEVDYERPIDAVPVAGTDGIAQPSQPDFSKITVKLKLPRANATNLAYLATFQAGTPQKMTIAFTGPLIEALHYYTLVLGFTRLVLMDPPDAPLDGMISNTLTFEFQESAAAPLGMTGHVRPYLTLENLATTDYLA